MTADIYDRLLAEARKGCYCEPHRKPCTYHEGFADGLETVLRETASAPDTGMTPEFEALGKIPPRQGVRPLGNPPNLVAMLAAQNPAATLTCIVCGDVLPADDWAYHVHSVPESALEGGDLCGQEACGGPACTLIAGHDGPHEQWEG